MNTTIIGAAVIIFIGIKESSGASNTTSRLTLVMIVVSLICAMSNDIREAIQTAKRDALMKSVSTKEESDK